ncbi:L-rhamnose isomerase [Candidatus Sumerlaeota bacterium]|nr:L-rhamnose isomerase [Candidatus Sumerlaeota bacterium]
MAESNDRRIESAYNLAREQYAELGVDTDQAMSALEQIPISLHCWQGDDVQGFESSDGDVGGGLAVTGNYPGRARTPQELRDDLDMAYSMIPGKGHRLNLHAFYLEASGKVDRAEIAPEHFQTWLDWAKEKGHGLDFNPTCFSHPMADSGFTLSSVDPAVRDYWVRHCIACRKIGEHFGRELNNPCVTNIWIPDGYKDIPIDRNAARQRLAESLDKILAAQVDTKLNLDAVECKLFGIGSESCVIGSHEFYMGYAIKNQTLLCLDAGHFHPTEVISDKISSALLFLDEILLHVSRGVRWDSDHVVILSDELRAIAEEIVRNNFQSRVHIGLDFFDASINRVAAWTIGTRSMLKALLIALLEPTVALREMEDSGDYTKRLAMLEELKTMPWSAVWDHHCLQQGVPVGPQWLEKTRQYEEDVLSKR